LLLSEPEGFLNFSGLGNIGIRPKPASDFTLHVPQGEGPGKKPTPLTIVPAHPKDIFPRVTGGKGIFPFRERALEFV
jgi:hypothetical protein